MPVSSSGNSPAMKQVTGSNWICAPVPLVVGEDAARPGPADRPAGAGAGGVLRRRALRPGPARTAEATATSSTSALATRPSATATLTGAWPTARPGLALGGHRVLAGGSRGREAAVGARDRAHDRARLQLDEGDRHARERPALEPHDALDRPGRGRRAHVARGQREQERQKHVGGAAQGTHAPRS